MGKSSPPAPDYRGAAMEQAQASQDIAAQTNWANRPAVNTPWGSQSWQTQKSIDPATGKPVTQWTSNVNLSPQQQAALDDQMSIQAGRSDAAQQLLSNATQSFRNPMAWGDLPTRGDVADPQNLRTSLNGGSTDYRQRAQDAVDQLMQPSLDQRRHATETQLAAQGLSMDSEAYKNAMRDVNDNENRAHLQAIDSGRAEAAQQFGQDLQGGQFENVAKQSQFGMDLQQGNFQNQNRQQAIIEMLQKRGVPLNELNALLTGQQVNMPSFPGANTSAASGQAPNLTGAVQNQYGAAWNDANMQNSQTSQAASAAAMMAMLYFSDERLKEDIRDTGVLLPSGLRVVHYRYRGMPLRHVGVIAQEALQHCPEAVCLHPSGYLMVNYGKVH